MKAMLERRRKQSGQGMTEYIIIVVAVALLSLAVVMGFGNTIRSMFIGSSEELGTGSTSAVGDKMSDDAKKGSGYEKLDDLNN